MKIAVMTGLFAKGNMEIKMRHVFLCETLCSFAHSFDRKYEEKSELLIRFPPREFFLGADFSGKARNAGHRAQAPTIANHGIPGSPLRSSGCREHLSRL